jgi:hypothetical protein
VVLSVVENWGLGWFLMKKCFLKVWFELRMGFEWMSVVFRCFDLVCDVWGCVLVAVD